jgi:multidrug efflux pump subunit AcrA (membrane-fusion protein)
MAAAASNSGRTDGQIDSTSRQIEQLFAALVRAAEQGLEPDRFYRLLLENTVTAMAALGGGLWLRNPAQPDGLQQAYRLVAQPQLAQLSDEANAAHAHLVKIVAGTGRVHCYRPSGGLLRPTPSAASDSSAADFMAGDSMAGGEPADAGARLETAGSLMNPTPWLIMICPLLDGRQRIGAIEIIQRTEVPTEALGGYEQFLVQVAALVGRWSTARRQAAVPASGQMRKGAADPPATARLATDSTSDVSVRSGGPAISANPFTWKDIERLILAVNASRDLQPTAMQVVNEACRLLDCDRVWLTIGSGRGTRLLAVSGQELIDRRSQLGPRLVKLVRQAVPAGEAIWWRSAAEPGGEAFTPGTTTALEQLRQLSSCTQLAVLPISGEVRRSDTPADRLAPPLGHLVLEDMREEDRLGLWQQRWPLIGSHIGQAIGHALDQQRIPLLGLWRVLGRFVGLWRPAALPKTLTALALIGCAVLTLYVVPAEFTLRGNGQLQPLVAREVFTPVDGEVEQVLVDHGSVVQAGQLLVSLKNPELDKELRRLEGELQITLERLATVTLRLSDRARQAPAELSRLESDKAELELRQQNLREELRLIERKREQLERRSPMGGVVTTWDAQRILRGRPVLTGQALLTVVDPTGPWGLEVLMPEKVMRHLDQAMAASTEDYLVVDFRLATDAATVHSGKLYRHAIEQRAEWDDQEGAVVRTMIEPDDPASLPRKAGARVTARVRCGQRTLGFVWLHEIADWLYAQWWL